MSSNAPTRTHATARHELSTMCGAHPGMWSEVAANKKEGWHKVSPRGGQIGLGMVILGAICIIGSLKNVVGIFTHYACIFH